MQTFSEFFSGMTLHDRAHDWQNDLAADDVCVIRV
jgi:hypothetical protein